VPYITIANNASGKAHKKRHFSPGAERRIFCFNNIRRFAAKPFRAGGVGAFGALQNAA
jgi:hypothetical protein